MDPTTKQVTTPLSGRLDEGHDYAGMPPIVAGVPQLEPRGTLRVLNDADWICVRGPCRHYMRLEHSIDAERPRETDGKLATHYANGELVKPFTRSVHTCFPAYGIEIPMTDEIVTACSWWDPEDPADEEIAGRELRRAAYLKRESQVELDRPAALPANKAEAEAVILSFLAALPSHADHATGKHRPVAANRPGGTFAMIECSCKTAILVSKEEAQGVREADRKAVVEAIRLIGPPKLDRAGPPAPAPAPKAMTGAEAAEVLRILARKQLEVSADHKGDGHGVVRAGINDNGSMLRIVCMCSVGADGVPEKVVVRTAGNLPDPKVLGRILAAGVKSIP